MLVEEVVPSMVVTARVSVFAPATSGTSFRTHAPSDPPCAGTPLTVTDEFDSVRVVPRTVIEASPTTAPSNQGVAATLGAEAISIDTGGEVAEAPVESVAVAVIA